MLGRVTIESEALEVLVQRTGGSPFAVETTVQEAATRGAIVRSGASWVIGASAIAGELAPASLAQALDRTLLRIPEADARVFRLLAVLNRPVSVPLLCEIGLGGGPGSADSDLSQILASLRSPHFVQRGWAFGRYHYSLRHAQLRERIYGAIEPGERALLHERAGAALERLYPGQARYLEDIALHYRRAGSLEKASRAARAAARQARRVYDFARAAALYEGAYELLDALPKESERSLEMADLAMSLAEVSLYRPSPRLAPRLTQALEVISESGDTLRRIRVHNALGRTYYALGRNPEAIRCFRELLRLTEGSADDLMRALPLSVLGRVYIFMGRFEEACDYLTRAASLLRAQPGAEDELAYALGMLGGGHIYLGHFEKALELTWESRAIARSLGSPLRVNQADIYEGILLAIRGDYRAARPAGNIIGAGTGSGFLGLTYLMEGDARRAVELCRFGRHHIAAAGGTWTFSMIGSFLAEALLAVGEVDEALQVALETVPIVDGGERWGEAFLHTALGRIHAARGDRAEARRAFERAIEVSRGQKSPVFEASSRLWFGAFLLSIGDREAALAELALARRDFELFNMRWHLARALAEAEAGGKGGPREIVGFAGGRG
jgi:tetratricopeptide (TPR) repeat protein